MKNYFKDFKMKIKKTKIMLNLWLYLVIILLGTSLKFYKLNYSLFWFDEITTVMHTSGYQVFDIPKNEIKSIKFYDDQFHLKKTDQSIISQLKGLYSRPNLNPFHYSCLMVWYRIAGDSDISYRFFNIFIFILTSPILFLLAKTLFKSNLAGWVAVSLYSVSPYFQFYVQEARYNTLLVFLIILLHYLFILALSHKKFKWWILYILVGAMTLYASVLSGLIIAGHFLYILFFKKEARIYYTISLIIILLIYLPWIILLINNSEEIVNSLSWHSWYGNINFIILFIYQLFGSTRIFSIFSEFPNLYFIYFNHNFIQQITDIVIMVLIIVSMIYTIKKAPKQILFFLILIFLPFTLFFEISDVIRNTGGSIFLRYQAINFISVLLFVVYFLSRKIELSNKILYSGVFMVLIMIGFISIFFVSNTRCSSPLCNQSINDAQFFSEKRKPLLITDYYTQVGRRNIGYFMVFLHECKSDSIDVLRATPDIENIEEKIDVNNYSDIYVTYASKKLVDNLKSQFGNRMDSLSVNGISPSWTIKY